MSKWSHESPANIALIKYMGKIDGADKNTASNLSLSYTLPNLKTKVVIEEIDGSEDRWEPLNEEGWMAKSLGDNGRNRYLNHFKFLKDRLSIQGNYLVKSANNFPSDCGLASSASSFAALTECTYNLAEDKGTANITFLELADLSRQGSGSSCRSFFEPWCVWDKKVSPISFPYENLYHQVIIISDEKKEVSSSEAHKRVLTSPDFSGRAERAQERFEELKEAFENEEWVDAFEVVWDEFFDMHDLFETSDPKFSYMTTDTIKALELLKAYWAQNNDGPLVTMDAGPNIHLLWREDQKDQAQSFEKSTLKNFRVFTA